MWSGVLTTIGIVVILLIIAYNIDASAKPPEDSFNVICLGGVEYWYRQTGYKGMVAVKLDAQGAVTICKE